jgi:hypothetical protein
MAKAKAKKWRVVQNGRLPALAEFDTFHEAMTFVSNTTGETFDAIKQNTDAGCPTTYRDIEFDIEEV